MGSWRAVELYSYCIPLGSPKVMYSSTVYVHLYSVSALFVFHSTLVVRIPTVFRHCLTRKRTQAEHIMRPFQLCSTSFPAYPSVRISTVFQHCRRAFLLCSSTQCCTQCTQCCALLRRNACTQCWNSVGIRTKTLHFYFAPTLFVCIFLL